MWLRNHLVNPVVRTLLRSPARRLLGRDLLVLRYTGRRTGRTHSVPVLHASTGNELVVLAGDHRRKRWWRNFSATPRPVTVLLAGCEEPRLAVRPAVGSDEHDAALRAYHDAFPRLVLDPASPVLVLRPDPSRAGPGLAPRRWGLPARGRVSPPWRPASGPSAGPGRG